MMYANQTHDETPEEYWDRLVREGHSTTWADNAVMNRYGG